MKTSSANFPLIPVFLYADSLSQQWVVSQALTIAGKRQTQTTAIDDSCEKGIGITVATEMQLFTH